MAEENDIVMVFPQVGVSTIYIIYLEVIYTRCATLVNLARVATTPAGAGTAGAYSGTARATCSPPSRAARWRGWPGWSAGSPALTCSSKYHW